MYKNLVFALITSVSVGSFVSAQDDGEINPIPAGGVLGDNVVTIVYDPGGSWWTDYNPGAGDKLITTLELTSSADFFTDPRPDWVVGNFDIYTPKKAFKLDPAGFGALGKAGAKPGMTAAELSPMLTAIGSWAGGGALGPVDLMVVPEPSSFVLLAIGVLAMLKNRRRL